jgi:hypothetical protein
MKIRSHVIRDQMDITVDDVITSDAVIAEDDVYWHHHSGLLSHLTILSIRHVGIADSQKLKRTSLKYPMA